MSLKTFHIFFIILASLTAFGFAAWEINFYSVNKNLIDLVLGLFSIFVGLSLIIYGKKFLEKLKNVSFM
ncbi:hypothetical protein IT568_08495 [bacterium]|nr:hypothetical protein [bacterium]